MTDYLRTDYPAARPASSGTVDEPSIKDRATESAQAGRHGAGEVAETAVSKAQEVVSESKAQARNLVGEARDQLRGHAGEQHRNAITNLRSLAQELHSMAGSGQQGGVATELVSKAADRADGAASWLDDREPGDLLEELRRFARRRPGAFLVGALAAGLVTGRLTRGVVAAHSDDEGGAEPRRTPDAVGRPSTPITERQVGSGWGATTGSDDYSGQRVTP